MSVPSCDAWLDDDGKHVWIEHPCVGGLERTMLPSTWRASESGWVEPSVICDRCGLHQFVNVKHKRRWSDG